MAKFNGGMGGFGGMGNMQNLVRQAQKMQEDMKKAEESLSSMEFEGSAGGGLVTIKMNGDKAVLSVTIKPEACDPDDIEMLEDLVTAAINDATKQANDAYDKAMAPFKGIM